MEIHEDPIFRQMASLSPEKRKAVFEALSPKERETYIKMTKAIAENKHFDLDMGQVVKLSNKISKVKAGSVKSKSLLEKTANKLGNLFQLRTRKKDLERAHTQAEEAFNKRLENLAHSGNANAQLTLVKHSLARAANAANPKEKEKFLKEAAEQLKKGLISEIRSLHSRRENPEEDINALNKSSREIMDLGYRIEANPENIEEILKDFAKNGNKLAQQIIR